MAIKVVVPEMGESVLEATVSRWLKQPGEYVNVGDVLVELETDKVNLEVGARNAGVLSQVQAQEGAEVKVGDVLGLIDEQAAPAPAAKAEPAPAPQARSGSDQGDGKRERPATPVASRVARDRGVDLRQVPGSGPEGRVTRADVEQFVQNQAPAGGPVERSRPETSERGEERVRMSRRRRTIAQRLLEASQGTAMLTTFNEVDMGAVMDLRRRRNEEFQRRFGVKLGISSFFVKAAISALKAFPRLNAEIQGEEIVLKHYYDIGVAIGAEEGLVVPVLRAADRMSFAAIEAQIKDLAARSEQGRLSIEELLGGTFTITNGGVFGSLLSTPILNPPQVGILGLHKIEDRPVAVEGEVRIRPMMYVALSYDHRIVDGREAVQFLVHIKQLLEDPGWLLVLEG
jgi:2-oxoglutarate dehydrogenase E2 component (dihydrolipoamide succinyltransferase)